MLTLDTIEVQPFNLSFEPTIKFTAKFTSTNEDILPIGCSGNIALNNQYVGLLTPFNFGMHGEENFNSNNSSNGNVRKHHFPLVITLTKTMLQKIEEGRRENTKADLILDINIRVKYLVSEFTSSNPDVKNAGHLVHLKNNTLFKFYDKDYPYVCKISKMDWLHDYSSIFNKSEYMVIDLPISKFSRSRNVSSKRINSTFMSIQEMKDSLDNGDWSGVIKASRPIWELLQHEDEIISVLKKDGMNQQTVESFQKLMKTLFDFASKYVHRQEKGSKNVMDDNFAKREDAELIYLISASVINILVQKS
jgi:hypothetical protein